MGITCKPVGKMGSLMKKMENQVEKDKIKNAARKASKKSVVKDSKSK